MKKFCNVDTEIGNLFITLSCQSYGRVSYEITLSPTENLLPEIVFYYSQSNELIFSENWETDVITPYELAELSRVTNEALKWQKEWNWDYES